MSSRFPTGKTAAMREYERSTLVVTKIDPVAKPKPRRADGLSPAMRERFYIESLRRR